MLRRLLHSQPPLPSVPQAQCTSPMHLDTALALIEEMRSRNIQPNTHTYSSLLNVCVKAGQLNMALGVYNEVRPAAAHTVLVCAGCRHRRVFGMGQGCRGRQAGPLVTALCRWQVCWPHSWLLAAEPTGLVGTVPCMLSCRCWQLGCSPTW